jgi:hypothetical protein
MLKIRDGIPLLYRGAPPVYFRLQRNEKDLENKIQIQEKLSTVLERRYFIYGLVPSLAYFFTVTKVETYISMVYNGTSSGLNQYLWAPWFDLPTTMTLLRNLEGGTWMTYLDIGGVFLNFILEARCSNLVGVDLNNFLMQEHPSTQIHVMLWGRCFMGTTSSP